VDDGKYGYCHQKRGQPHATLAEMKLWDRPNVTPTDNWRPLNTQDAESYEKKYYIYISCCALRPCRVSCWRKPMLLWNRLISMELYRNT
jgi:hypothetical protein